MSNQDAFAPEPSAPGIDYAALHAAASELASYAAAIKWSARETNTADWLNGLAERIEAVQAFGPPDAPAPLRHKSAERLRHLLQEALAELPRDPFAGGPTR